MAVAFFLLGLVFMGCSNNKPDSSNRKASSDVAVTTPVLKDTAVFETFQGITRFMQHLQIKAQSTGIITESFASAGQEIKPGEPLFVVKSREAILLESSSKSGDLISNMADTVFAFSRATISEVMVQAGDFVMQGDVLANCVIGNSMRVVVSVPLENDLSEFPYKNCVILLPDGRTVAGHVGEMLPVASNQDQTGKFLIIPRNFAGMVESIHVRVRVKKRDIVNGLFVPQSSVFANEELTDHWVLKVIHDTLAIKIMVNPGIEADSLVQLKKPMIKPGDTLIFRGGYALPDSASVNVTQAYFHEKR